MFITNALQHTETAVRARRRTLYAINFFFAIHLALVTYYFSPFLISHAVPAKLVGTLFTLGAIVTLILLALLPRLQRQVSNYALLLFASLLEISIFVIFAVSTSLWMIIPAFALSFAIPVVLGLLLDFLLEENTPDERTTGRVRTFYITASNLGWIISPIVGGTLLEVGNFSLLFIVSAFVMVPFTILALIYFRSSSPRVSTQGDMRMVWQRILRSTDLRGVFLAQFLLQLFYTIAVIYIPLYLFQTIGFTYETIGTVSAIMLIPFILIEIPAGKLADTRFGEREMLAFGLLIAGLATMLAGTIASQSFIVWAGILFITRVGAALIDAMSNSYFFKQVTETDTALVTAFRSLSSFAYIIGPLFASIFLFSISLPTLFVITGVIILLGIPLVLMIHDSR